ncbi:MAG TPA: hypothetical protein VGP63_05785 [Planctomycetaceae bacterium]|jgi:hypothetical protein|nr:hypothetical protein [Planctomycetaceae bacterium]
MREWLTVAHPQKCVVFAITEKVRVAEKRPHEFRYSPPEMAGDQPGDRLVGVAGFPMPIFLGGLRLFGPPGSGASDGGLEESGVPGAGLASQRVERRKLRGDGRLRRKSS